MPKYTHVKKVLVIGSGPIIIGQAAEFDYSGTQACRALKEEGVEVVLINSNPATIMTDKGVADSIYIEPITFDSVLEIIEKERPDHLLAGMGGQTALNMAVELYDAGVLERLGIGVLGTSIESIKTGESRQLFKACMDWIGEPTILSKVVCTVEQGLDFAGSIGLPVVIRPAYTMGGLGGGIAETQETLVALLESGLSLSPVTEVLVERSIKGWKEVEYEVMRDAYGNRISFCNMENLDPVGIHTGDSIVVAPSQTLTDRAYQMLRNSALKIIDAVGIIGGCNVQFALHPTTMEYAVIEINPRVSRSSALASKATGYPIAKVAAKIALGYALDEIKNEITGATFACFEPSLHYVVVKMPRWPFDKFMTADRTLGTKMMATGEVMAIGRSFQSAFLKALRSLEMGVFHLTKPALAPVGTAVLERQLSLADDQRIFALAELLRRSGTIDAVHAITQIDPWFLNHLLGIVKDEMALSQLKIESLDAASMRYYKKQGFSDRSMAVLMGTEIEAIEALRTGFGILPSFQMVDTCAGEFDALTPYYYSTYGVACEVDLSQRKKVLVIGSGPIRIGQGIEFDYASVHCVEALKELGYETIIVNNNPETVSTDFNVADKLYFEPITEEDVYEIIRLEQPVGVMLQYGGQTAIKLAKFLASKGVKLLGVTAEQISAAEDRATFDAVLEQLGIARPQGMMAYDMASGSLAAQDMGFPLMVRPSFVIGGQGMAICHDAEMFTAYLAQAFAVSKGRPVFIDRYIVGTEVEVDLVTDGVNVMIPGIMEHIEPAGIHSGDSVMVYPPQHLPPSVVEKICKIATRIALTMGFTGIANIQMIVDAQSEVHVIEMNPRASRTVPFLSKVTDIPIVHWATRAAMGEKLPITGLQPFPEHAVSVKLPVFSTYKITGVDTILGPEMQSTGEVMGRGKTYAEALCKGFLGVHKNYYKPRANICLSLSDADKTTLLAHRDMLLSLDLNWFASDKTAKLLLEMDIAVTSLCKEGIAGALKNGDIDILVNSPTLGRDEQRLGHIMRRIAAERNIPLLSHFETFVAWAEGYKWLNKV